MELTTADYGAGPGRSAELNTIALKEAVTAAEASGRYLLVTSGRYLRPDTLPPFVEIGEGVRFR